MPIPKAELQSDYDHILTPEEVVEFRDCLVWPFANQHLFNGSEISLDGIQETISGPNFIPNLLIVEAARGEHHRQFINPTNPKGIQYMRLTYGIPFNDQELFNGLVAQARSEDLDFDSILDEFHGLKVWRLRLFEFFKTGHIPLRDYTLFQLRDADMEPVVDNIGDNEPFDLSILEARRMTIAALHLNETFLLQRAFDLVATDQLSHRQ